MAFQFPANPTLGQIYETIPGVSYKWNGTGWAPLSPTYFGGATFTGPVLFPDGTLNAPGIAWANETTMGWWRNAAGDMHAVVGGVPIMGISGTRVVVASNLSFNAGAANFSGNVTGITSTMVGLGNVVNNQQIWNYAPWNASIQMAWDGSMLAYSLNSGGGGSTTWPIHITGQARSMYTPQGVNQTFNWVGNAGQPTWLWGGESGSNSLFNPANFTVNYAHGAGNANRAAYVSNGANHSSTGFVFHWSDPSLQLNYLWGSNDGTNMYLQYRPSMNVNYANSCDYANRVGTINGATNGTTSGKLNMTGMNGSGGTAAYYAAALILNGQVPSIGFHYEGVTGWMISFYSTDFLIGNNGNGGPSSTGGGAIQMQGVGHIYARSFNPSGLVARDVVPFEKPLENLLKLRGVRCIDAETNEPALDVELDAVEFHFPEVVRRLDNTDGSLRGKSANHTMLIAPIIEAMREINERLTALENAI